MSKGGSTIQTNPDNKVFVAADNQAALGKAWLDYANEAYAKTDARIAELDALNTQVANEQRDYASKFADLADYVSGSQTAAADQALTNAATDRARYESTYQPVEDQFVAEAKDYGNASQQEQAAAQAITDVRAAAAAEKATAARQSAALGINPASGRYAGISRGIDLNANLGAVDAANKARQSIKDSGIALRAQTVGLGRDLASQSASETALGLNAGSAAAQTGATSAQLSMAPGTQQLAGSQANNAQALEATSIPMEGYKGAIAGYQGQAGTYLDAFNASTNASAANADAAAKESSGFWNAIGTGVGLILSDKKAKTAKKKVPDGVGLKAVKEMPVETWRYAAGIDDGRRHIGTYAQDFKKATGKGSGRTIPVGDAIGITMKAVQDLDKKVDKLASARPAAGISRKAA